MKVSYNWLAEYVENLPPVDEVVKALTMHSFEVEGVEEENGQPAPDHTEGLAGDKILDIKILPNRTHDCLSHYGIASEIASVMGLERKKIKEDMELLPLSGFTVEIKEKNLCRRMFAVLVKDVHIAPSPEWLSMRLRVMGQRPINNVVDITNYITYALGQPMHAFDADTIKGSGIIVRCAKEGEKITLLNDKECTLSKDMLVIADKEKALDVAGIMGGKHTATLDHTKNMLLVVDNFDPVCIRKTAKKLGIRTDASVRFENAISSSLVDFALPYTLELITQLTGGVVSGGMDKYPNPEKQTIVTTTAGKISDILGVSLDAQKIAELLGKQDIPAEEKEGKVVVTVPLERLDLTLPEDIAEEVGRLYGYENIPPESLSAGAYPAVSPIQYISGIIRQTLRKQGFSEIYTYSFVDHGEVEVANPIAGDKKYLRKNLSDAMAHSLEYNFKFLDLIGSADVKLFEMGKVFESKGPASTQGGEFLHLSLGVKYPKGKGKPDEEISKAITLVEKALGVSFGDISIVGGIAEVNLDKYIQEIKIPEKYPEDLWNMIKEDVSWKTISPYPFAVRDVAVFVPNTVSENSVRDLISRHLSPIVVRFSLFDTFQKEYKTSYAYRLVFQSMEKTLTDEEINIVMNSIYETLKSQEGFEIR